MRETRRIKRMSRNKAGVPKMNLTSLMDVFTILVFFLLVNSGSVEVLDAPKDVKLPESRVEAYVVQVVICSRSSASHIHNRTALDFSRLRAACVTRWAIALLSCAVARSRLMRWSVPSAANRSTV